MTDTIHRIIQDTIHHTVTDTVHTLVNDTVKFMEAIKNNSDGTSLKDNTAIVISIISVLFTGLGLILNYKLRKKDFQTQVFNKQFEAYQKFLVDVNKCNAAIYKDFVTYAESNDYDYSDLSQMIEFNRKTLLDELISPIYLFHNEIVVSYIDYDTKVLDIVNKFVPEDNLQEFITVTLQEKINHIQNTIRDVLAIEELSTETFSLLNKRNKTTDKKVKEKK